MSTEHPGVREFMTSPQTRVNNPTLLDEGDLTITITALSTHTGYCQLWIAPPGATGWHDMREIATGGTLSRHTTYTNVKRGTLLGWRLTAGGAPANTPYHMSLTCVQKSIVILNGSISCLGTTDSGGQAITEDHVTLL